MSKIISFATQKGGSGKSTLALVLAAPLATEYGLRVAILDCDYQQSILKTRTQIDAPSMAAMLEVDPDSKYPYDVFAVALDDVFEFTDEHSDDYDLIFIDVPGRADGEDVFNALTGCDAVIVPLVSDQLDRASTAEFMSILQSIKNAANKAGLPFEYFGLPTKRIAGRREEKEMEEYIDGLGLSRFNSFLSNRLAYSRASTLHSLLTPSFRAYAGGTKDSSDEIRRVCEELIERLGLPNHNVASVAAAGTAEAGESSNTVTE
jgi:chromosome partitioning protein